MAVVVSKPAALNPQVPYRLQSQDKNGAIFFFFFSTLEFPENTAENQAITCMCVYRFFSLL